MESRENGSGKSLKYSIRDGVFASLMTGFTVDYFTPFLLLLGGSLRHVAVLSALPNLVASLVQLKSADIPERLKSRKRVINIFVFLQALMLLPMTASFVFGQARIAVFIATVTLFTSFGAFVTPAWGSLMADLVREDKRGEYFGWRNKVLGLVTIAATFGAGFVLHQTERFNLFAGFSIVFGLAFVFRIVSWRYLMKMHEPPMVHREEDRFSIIEFISRANKSNFARFVIFVSAMKFAVNIASPFFAVLMIRDLKFNYMTYTLVTLAATLATNFTIKRWGVHADRVGNLKVIRLTSRFIALIPLLWIVNQDPYFLFAAQLFSGFAWAGFNLSASNFIYDAASPAKRTRCIAYFNVFNGLSLCLGALLGGYLAQITHPGFLKYNIMNLVLVSAILRMAVAFFVPFKIKEVREVEKIKSRHLLYSMIRLKWASRGKE
ncbi:MAG TPA: MFS transporter [Thermodesulfobacteriota bacterium]|nr:MFS transporter [Thermodesulfobacteriota bacterium]